MAFPDWTEEHEAFRASVRRFTEEEIRPHAEEWDAKGGFPDDIFPKAGKLGLLGVRFDYGALSARPRNRGARRSRESPK